MRKTSFYRTKCACAMWCQRRIEPVPVRSGQRRHQRCIIATSLADRAMRARSSSSSIRWAPISASGDDVDRACLPVAMPLLTYDKRGHGLSDVGQAPYSIDDHVDDLIGAAGAFRTGAGQCRDLRALCRRTDRPRALHSAGRRSGRRHMILCDTAHKIGTTEMLEQPASQGRRRSKGIQAIADGVLKVLVHAGLPRQPRWPSLGRLLAT